MKPLKKKTVKHYWDNYNMEKYASFFLVMEIMIKLGEIKEKRKGRIENLYLV